MIIISSSEFLQSSTNFIIITEKIDYLSFYMNVSFYYKPSDKIISNVILAIFKNSENCLFYINNRNYLRRNQDEEGEHYNQI